ncbi:hypothetical protein [Clostridium senegalense]|uniref:Uncharacterized protein n=1 Tax=Clostridium senegalense TaxID=1465809 RepID=A0A6M0H431_9CLOT|nr:hypothetical protein [Clostridium senegalense]NEU05490.1 hypothetical protein [Clostridium senegalense]
MKYKTAVIIQCIISIFSILVCIVYFTRDIKVPGLIPGLMSVLMLSLIYTSKQQFNSGKISKKYWMLILCTCSLAAIFNIVVCIEQIIVFMK